MGNTKEINMKSWSYYFFDDMINIKNFDPNLLKVDKKLHKNIDIYYIDYITMKDLDYVKINSVNSQYLIIGEGDGYIEEKNGNKYLTLVSADENKMYLKSIQNFEIKNSKVKKGTKNSIDKINN